MFEKCRCKERDYNVELMLVSYGCQLRLYLKRRDVAELIPISIRKHASGQGYSFLMENFFDDVWCAHLHRTRQPAAEPLPKLLRHAHYDLQVCTERQRQATARQIPELVQAYHATFPAASNQTKGLQRLKAPFVAEEW